MNENQIYSQVEEKHVDEEDKTTDFDDDLDMCGNDIYEQVEGDTGDEKCSTAGPVDGDENPQEAYETPVSLTIQSGQLQPSSSDYEIPLKLTP